MERIRRVTLAEKKKKEFLRSMRIKGKGRLTKKEIRYREKEEFLEEIQRSRKRF